MYTAPESCDSFSPFMYLARMNFSTAQSPLKLRRRDADDEEDDEPVLMFTKRRFLPIVFFGPRAEMGCLPDDVEAAAAARTACCSGSIAATSACDWCEPTTSGTVERAAVRLRGGIERSAWGPWCA